MRSIPEARVNLRVLGKSTSNTLFSLFDFWKEAKSLGGIRQRLRSVLIARQLRSQFGRHSRAPEVVRPPRVRTRADKRARWRIACAHHVSFARAEQLAEHRWPKVP